MVKKFDVHGLSDGQVAQSRTQFGPNSLPPPEVETFWEKLKDNFDDPLIRILCVALGVTLLLAYLGYADWLEGIGIAMAVFLATFVATYSEFKNEASFQELQEKASRIKCNVFRNGAELVKIEINDVVVGDNVLLQAGDRVPADGVMLFGWVGCNNSSLNGENETVRKTPPHPSDVTTINAAQLAEGDFNHPHLLYRGAVVDDGEGVMRVLSVGEQTIYGKLAIELAQNDDREAPLQVKLANLADGISMLGYIGATFIAISFLFKQIVMDNQYEWVRMVAYVSNWQVFLHDMVTSLILAIIIIVVAVPEGLPMMIAIVLSLNMSKLLKNQVLVRRLLGIETAGAMDLLFADKTGTITEGVFHPEVFVTGDVTQYASVSKMPRNLANVLAFAIRESSSAVINVDHEHNDKISIVGGNASDRALLHFTGADYLRNDKWTTTLESEVLFTSIKKFSAAQVRVPASLVSTLVGGRSPQDDFFDSSVKGDLSITLVKGAAEVVLDACTRYYTPDGRTAPLKSVQPLLEEINRMSSTGTRVIAVATSGAPLSEDLPPRMSLVGIVGVADRVRPESRESMQLARAAGIQVVMITGDRQETAVAVARSAGLLEPHDGAHSEGVVTGAELRNCSREELERRLPKLRVVARALPSDKSLLVNVAQNIGRGRVVGMTGDGVNDSAALKKSDVSFAMGSGSEVAKEASDIVILDDNFASIMRAVLYGRTIFKSIRKFVVFQSTINVASTLIVFLGPFLGFDFPLTLIQLLWVNLVMDTLAALAFGGEAALTRYMDERPIARDAPIINPTMWSSILFNGTFIALYSTLFLVWDPILELFHRAVTSVEVHANAVEVLTAAVESASEVRRQGGAVFLTAFFAFFIFLCTFNAFNVRTTKLNLFDHLFDNQGFVFVIPLIFVIQITFTYIGGSVLRTVPLTANEWLLLLGMTFLIIPLDLVRKFLMQPLMKRAEASPERKNV